MISAVIDTQTNTVVNLIVADPAVDAAPEGCLLVANPPDYVEIGTAWKRNKGFIKPVGNAPPISVQGIETL